VSREGNLDKAQRFSPAGDNENGLLPGFDFQENISLNDAKKTAERRTVWKMQWTLSETGVGLKVDLEDAAEDRRLAATRTAGGTISISPVFCRLVLLFFLVF